MKAGERERERVECDGSVGVTSPQPLLASHWPVREEEEERPMAVSYYVEHQAGLHHLRGPEQLFNTKQMSSSSVVPLMLSLLQPTNPPSLLHKILQ